MSTTMKRMIAIIIALIVFLCPFSFAEDKPQPEVFTSGDQKYIVLEDGTACIAYYFGQEEEVVVPENLDGKKVTAIGDYAFFYSDCTVSITIPNSVTSIGDHSFFTYKALKSFIVSPDHPTLEVKDGVLFSKTDKRLIRYPSAITEESYAIPEGTTFIGDYAFYQNDSLTSVTIPDSVTGIGEYAFCQCGSLESLTIPAGVTSIGEGAFDGCEKLDHQKLHDTDDEDDWEEDYDDLLDEIIRIL